MVKESAKRLMAILCLVVIVSLSGCSPMEATDDFLAPPKASGDMLLIEQTLEKSVSGKYILKYPTAGDYRSAYVLTDLLNTGKKDFALAFYSAISTENVSTMHLNLMKEVDGTWVEYSDVQISAVGVEKVEFCDLDNDGAKEIVVGWNIYSNVEKKVAVYSIQGKTLSSHTQESYWEFICCDLDSNDSNELFILNHVSDKNTATAKLLSFDNEGAKIVGDCNLSGAVTSFSVPKFSKLTNGTPAVFIDSTLTNGTQTDILFFENGQLVDPIYSDKNGTQAVTFRSSATACSDINNDGCMDIPLSIQPKLSAKTDSAVTVLNFTEWCSFDSHNLVVTMLAAMNYTDGYYFEIPNRWKNKITVENTAESRTCSVMLWSSEGDKAVGELVCFKTIAESEWDKSENGYSSYTEITRSGSSVFAAMTGNYSGSEAIDMNELREIFHVIN